MEDELGKIPEFLINNWQLGLVALGMLGAAGGLVREWVRRPYGKPAEYYGMRVADAKPNSSGEAPVVAKLREGQMGQAAGKADFSDWSQTGGGYKDLTSGKY